MAQKFLRNHSVNAFNDCLEQYPHSVKRRRTIIPVDINMVHAFKSLELFMEPVD